MTQKALIECLSTIDSHFGKQPSPEARRAEIQVYISVWSSPNLYFGLLTMCPTCRRYEVTNNLWWWEWVLPEIQEEYSRALNASTGERRNE